MPEEQAFCVLVKIMYEYGLRALYKNNFEDLHCKFYQLERLMQVSNAMFYNIWKLMEYFNAMESNEHYNYSSKWKMLISGFAYNISLNDMKYTSHTKIFLSYRLVSWTINLH